MAHIKIEDLPIYQEMSPEQMEAILGAGRFARLGVEMLETRELMSASPIWSANVLNQNVQVFENSKLVATQALPSTAPTFLTDNAVASALQQAHFGASTSAQALQSIFKDGDAAAAAALQKAGYGANDTASALQSIYGDTDLLAAGVLRLAGFSDSSTIQALQSVFHDTAANQAAITEGLGALVRWAGSQSLPLLGSPTGLEDLLKNGLANPISASLAKNAASSQAFLTSLQSLNGMVAGSVKQVVNSGGAVAYSLEFKSSETVATSLPSLGSQADQLGIKLDPSTKVNVTTNLDFKFTFGVDASGAFYLQLPTANAMTVGVSINATGINSALNLGFLGAKVSNGSIQMSLQAALNFQAAQGGKLTLAQLQSSPLALTVASPVTITLPVQATLGSFNGNGTLTISNPNLASSSSSWKVNLTGFGSDWQKFTAFNSSDVLSLLNQLAGQLGQIATQAWTSQVPLASNLSIGQLANLQQAFQSAFLSKLSSLDPTSNQSIASFVTAQDLGNLLAKALNITPAQLGLSFNPTTNNLTYNLNFTYNFADLLPAQKTAALQLNLNGGGLVNAQLSGLTLTTSTPLTSLNGGAGVRTTGSSSHPDLQFTLTDGSTFQVSLYGATTIQDVINRIQNASKDSKGNVRVQVSIDPNTNADLLVQQVSPTPAGSTTSFSIAALKDASGNYSHAAADLGIAGTAVGTNNSLTGTTGSNPMLTGQNLSGNSLALNPTLTANLTFGIHLAPLGNGFTLTSSTPLSSLNGGAGVRTTGSSSYPDLQVTLTDGSTFKVSLYGATTILDVINRIQNASKDSKGNVRVQVSIDPNTNADLLVQQVSPTPAGSTTSFSITALKDASGNYSHAAADLGIAGVAVGTNYSLTGTTGTNPTITGQNLSGDSLAKHFFIQNASFSFTLNASAQGITASANLGPIALGMSNGTGTLHVQAGLALQGLSGSQIYLSDLTTAIKDPATLAKLIGTPQFSGSAQLTLPLQLQTKFLGGFSLPTGAAVSVNWTDITKLSTLTVTPPKLDVQNLAMSTIINGLKQALSFLEQALGNAAFKQQIPVLNKSLADLVNPAAKLDAAIQSLTANPPATIDALVSQLTTLLGQNLTPTFTNGVFGLNLNYGFQATQMINLGFNVGALGSLADLSGSSPIKVDLNGSVKLDLAIDVTKPTSPQVYLNSDSGIKLSAGLNASNINFQASIGPLGLYISGGTASLDNGTPGQDASWSLGLNQSASRYSITDAFNHVTTAAPQAHLDVVLPVFFPTPNQPLDPSHPNIEFHVDLAHPSQMTTVLPDFSKAISNLSPDTLFNSVIAGWQGLMTVLTSSLVKKLASESIPVVGAQIEHALDFLQQLNTQVLAKLEAAPHLAAQTVEDALYNALGPKGGLGWLQELTTNKNPTESDYVQMTQSADGAHFLIKLANTYTTSVAFGTNLGLPGLGLNLAGNVSLNAGFTINLGFGVSKQQGFYLDSSDTADVKFSAQVQGAATGTLGFLQLSATPKTAQVTGEVSLHLNNVHSTGILSVADLASTSAYTFSANAGVNLDLQLQAGFGDPDLPSIGTEFLFQWNTDPSKPTTIGFTNVTITLGNFIENICNTIAKILKPVEPAINLLMTPVPIISQLIGHPYTLLDMATDLGEVDPGTSNFIKAAAGFLNGSIGKLLSTGQFNLGSFSIDATAAENASNQGNTTALKMTTTAPAKNDPSSPTPGFSIPLLQNPSSAFKLLLGQDVDLVTYDMGTMGVSLSYSQYFPIIGPLGATLTGTIGAKAHFDFGFDTSGFREFAQGGFQDPSLILNGLYVGADSYVGVYGSIAAYASLDLLIAQAGIGGGIAATLNFKLHDPTGGPKIHLEDIVNDIKTGTLFDATGALTAFLDAYVEVDLLFFSHRWDFQIASVTLGKIDTSSALPAAQQVPQLANESAGGVLRLNIGANAQDRLFGNKTDGNETLNVIQGPKANSVIVQGYGQSQEYDNVTKIVADGVAGGDNLTIAAGSNIDVDITGGAATNKIVVKSARNVTLTGGSGNDTLEVDNAASVVINGGSSGNQVLRVTGSMPATLQAGGGNDTLYGGSGAGQQLLAGSGADVLVAGSGAGQILHGGQGTSILIGGNGAGQQLFGDSSTTTIYGGSGAGQFLNAGAGNATLYAGNGDGQTLLGGSGNDTLAVGWKFVAGSLTTQGNPVGGSQYDTYSSRHAYTMQAGSGATLMIAGQGQDTLTGGTGQDTLRAGTGAGQQLIAGFGQATLYGGSGANQLLTGGNSVCVLVAGSGSGQILHGGHGVSTLIGGSGANQQLHGDDSTATLYGGTGANQLLDAGSGNDSLYAGEADGQTLLAGAGTDHLQVGWHFNAGTLTTLGTPVAGDTNDGAGHGYVMKGGQGNATLIGGRGNDTLSAGAGNDEMHGGEGDDVLYGSSGNDTLYGDGGNDQLHAGTGKNVLIGDYGTDPSVTGFKADPVPATGKPGNDTLYAGSGKDSLYGEAGDDTIVLSISQAAGASGMVIQGGPNADTIEFQASDQPNDITLSKTAAGAYQIHDWIMNEQKDAQGNVISRTVKQDLGVINFQMPVGVEFVRISGGAGDDRIAVDPAFNERTILDGGAGNDTLIGGAGDETLIGGAGNDLLVAGPGSDILHGGDGSTLPGGNDTLIGGGGTDVLFGEGGVGNTDLLIGGGGTSFLYGGAGNNIIFGDHYHDLPATLPGGAAGYTIPAAMLAALTTFKSEVVGLDATGKKVSYDALNTDSTNGVVIFGHPDLSSSQVGSDLIFGSAGDDVILGGGGGNYIDGRAGMDVIQGGAGQDTLIGGGGFDRVMAGSGNSYLYATEPGDPADMLEQQSNDQWNYAVTALNEGLLADTVDTERRSEEAESTDRAALNALFLQIDGPANDPLRPGMDNMTPAEQQAFIAAAEKQHNYNPTLGTAGFFDQLKRQYGTDRAANWDTYVAILPELDKTLGALSTILTTEKNAVDQEATMLGVNLTGNSSPAFYVLLGGAGDDTIFGSPDEDVIDGMGGNNTIYWSPGPDVIFGGSDPQTSTNVNTFVLQGTQYDDAITIDAVSRVTNTVKIDTAALNLHFQTNVDLLGITQVQVEGLAGNDTVKFTDEAKADGHLNYILDGGAGDDILDAGGTQSNVTLIGGAGNDTLTAGQGTDLLIGDATVYQGGAWVEQAVTGPDNDKLIGGNGFGQTLMGGVGNDTLIAGTGINQVLEGGAGDDILDASGSTSNDTLIGGAGNDTLTAGQGTDLLIGDDAVYQGGAWVEQAVTDPDDDNLIGGSGSGQTLLGGSGDDTLVAGTGNNGVFDGGTGVNQLIVQGTDGNDTIQVNPGQLQFNDSTDAFANIQNLAVQGGAGDDTIGIGTGLPDVVVDGGSGTNTMSASGGNTTLIGGTGFNTFTLIGSGNYTVDGGTGTNALTIQGDDGGDTIALAQNGSTITVSGTLTATATYMTSVAVIGGSGNDILDASGMTMGVSLSGGAGNDTLLGGSGNDTLDGGSGTDSLNGGAGDNRLYISDGADTYVGGGGNDHMVYRASAGDNIVVYGNGLLVNGSLQQDADTSYLSGTYVAFGSVSGIGTIEVEDGGANVSARAATWNDLPGVQIWYDAGGYSSQATVLTHFDYYVSGYGNITNDYTINWSQNAANVHFANTGSTNLQSWAATNWQSNSVNSHVVTQNIGTTFLGIHISAGSRHIWGDMVGQVWVSNWQYYWDKSSGYSQYGYWSGNVVVDPGIKLPQSQLLVEATGPEGAVVNYPPATTGGANPTTAVSYSIPSGSQFALGTTTVTATATDAAGNTSTSTFQVTVHVTTPPTGTAPANQTATEGQASTFNLGSFADSGTNDGPWTVTVNWGDSTPATTFTTTTLGALSQAHTYTDNGKHNVSVIVTDQDHARSTPATFSVNVLNAPPTVTAADNQTATIGMATTFNLGSFTDGAKDGPWTVSVNWGDSSAVTTFTTTTLGALGQLLHTYAAVGQYNVSVTVADSYNASSTANLNITIGPPALDFSSGFTGSSNRLAYNGSAAINGSMAELTNGGYGQAGSVFSSSAVTITQFTSQFSFRLSPGSNTADGFTFTIQGNSPTALGVGGGSLGYAGIAKSIAVKFDLYNNLGEGVDSTGLFINGAAPYNDGSVDLSQTGIDLHSGDTFAVSISYDGSNLSVTIKDTQTGASNTQTYALPNLSSIVGGNAAYVGFTAGTGGLTCTQDILNWTFTQGATTGTAVDLSGAFNQVGVTSDGSTYSSGGIDGSGLTLSANQLGSSVSANGLAYTVGNTGGNNVVSAAGQAISLPTGNYSTLSFLALGVNGNQANQTFTVTYTDGSTQTFTQSISDWSSPQQYAGESVALTMSYRNGSNGTNQSGTTNVYSYSFVLDPTKQVQSITLPNNGNVKVLAVVLASPNTTTAAAI